MTELPRTLSDRALSRRYDLLDPEERFRLALEAGARGDERERERLVHSAPMRTCRITEPGYIDRVDASRDLAVAVALELAPRMAELRALRAVREALGEPLALAVGREVSSGLAEEGLAVRPRMRRPPPPRRSTGGSRTPRVRSGPRWVPRSARSGLYAERRWHSTQGSCCRRTSAPC